MIGKKLNFGDTIGVISPASAEYSDKIISKINNLKQLGFNIKEGSHLYDMTGHLAGSDKDRAFDLMEMFLDPDVDIIMCFRGGYGSMRLLPLINFKKLSSMNKIFIGYSDITALLNTFYFRNHLITFHGPMVNSDFDNEFTLNSFTETLMNGTHPYSICNPTHIPIDSYGCSSTKGILVGGNLSMICATLGTPYEIDFRNKILFIEDIDEPPYSIDRLLTQLTLSGKLSSCRGFILGHFNGCDKANNPKSHRLIEVIEDRILSLNKPTLLNVASGHDNPNLLLPIGANIELDINSKCIHVLEPVVKY